MGQTPFLIADRAGVEAILDTLAGRLAAELPQDFALIGVIRRGEVLARRLAERLERRFARRVPAGEVRLERYADDLSVLHRQVRLETRDLPFAVDGARLVLVDDVLYSGRSLLTAARHFLDAGAAEVRLAVLVDRGGRQAPVAADFAGLRLEVGPPNQVEVHVPPYEEGWAIWVRERGRPSDDRSSA
jgi:pyrimidine operon attenuation protein/uracil phosphoribosyltransferase